MAIACFTFPLPPTLNEQIRLARTHWSVSAREKKIWTNKISLMCYGGTKFPGKVWMQFQWQVKNFKKDNDNVSAASKYALDGLVDAGILTGDSLAIIQSPVIHWYERAKTEQVIITISDSPLYLIQPVQQNVLEA